MPTKEQTFQWQMLKMADDKLKFAIPINGLITGDLAVAFDYLIENGYFSLLDVAPVDAAGGHLCRVYRLSDKGFYLKNELAKLFPAIDDIDEGQGDSEEVFLRESPNLEDGV